jgi:DNA-binding MarR family transcriptional regulator
MDSEQIGCLRRFNRAFTRRIGALEDSFLDRGRPLGEARLIYEIGPEGGEIRALRARLGLDSGYMSRLLRSLESQGLVTGMPGSADGRVRRVALTEAGRREREELDRRSDAFAESVLAPLAPAHRERLVAAMAEVERLMQAAAIVIAPEPPDSADARACLDAYFRELALRFESGFDPSRGISADPAELTPPAGAFLLARLDGRPLGCGALKAKAGGIGEVKRMWVAAEARGLGLGRRLLATLEDQARSLGLATLRLETNRSLEEAQALYRRCGYREVAAFNDEPYAHHWFEKTLG